jgi:hypothetical protein
MMPPFKQHLHPGWLTGTSSLPVNDQKNHAFPNPLQSILILLFLVSEKETFIHMADIKPET